MSGAEPKTKPKKVLAIASGGGHWIELLRLRPAFEDHKVTYATVQADYRSTIGDEPLYIVPDATQWQPVKSLWLAVRMLAVVVRVWPDVVISTGAAPGYFGVLFGKLLGAKTIWVDSLANVEELSRAGRMANRFADLWLTQWPELEEADGPRYFGSVV